MSKTCFCAAVALALTTAGAGRAEAGFLATVDDPKVQATTVSGALTEDFEGATLGEKTSLKTAIGTITSPGLAILPADQYGGAGGTGKYIAIGAQSGNLSMTLNLTNPEAYFGLWWSAVDANNRIAFYSKGQEIAAFDPTQALGLPGSSYNGNPNNGLDGNERFAYLNFIGTQGTTFDQVVFSNLNLSTGFESDNWSVSATTPGTIPGTPVPGLTAVPEPSSLALAAIGIVGGGAALARRRRR